MHVGALRALASSEPPVGTVRAQNLCGADPLVAVPHTSMCMGVDSFTERTGGPHVMWAYISLHDLCKVTQVILWGSIPRLPWGACMVNFW